MDPRLPHRGEEEREHAASLLLRLSNQQLLQQQEQEQQRERHSARRPPPASPPAPVASPPIVLLDDHEAAEKRKLSINFLLNTPAASATSPVRVSTSPPTSTTSSSSSSSTSTSGRRSPPLPSLPPLPSALPHHHHHPYPTLQPVGRAPPTNFFPSPPPPALHRPLALSSGGSTTSPSPSTPSPVNAFLPAPAGFGVAAPLSPPSAQLQGHRLPLPSLPPPLKGGAAAATINIVDEEDALRLRREVHLQRQRKLLLDLLKEKQKEIDGKWGGNGHDDVIDGLVVDERRTRAKADSGWRRRPVGGMSIDDGLDGIDGLVEVGFKGMPTRPRRASHRRTSSPSGAYNPANGQRGPWTSTGSSHHRANGHHHPHGSVNNPNSNAYRRAAREQSLSLVSHDGGLNELDEDDEASSPPELTRLYGGSNHHQQLDESARRRRRHSTRMTPPSTASAGSAEKSVAPESRREEQEEGDLDGEWPDVGDTAQFRSSMPPLPLHLRRPSLASPSSEAATAPTTNAGDGTDSDSYAGQSAAAAAAAEDCARKRASPEQMQMLQQILSFYEQSPQKIQELERSAVVPIRRRKRRNDGSAAIGTGATPSAAPASSALAVENSELQQVREGEGSGSDDSSGSRKRRRRDREVLIFHHMKVQDDGKMMVTQRS